MIDKNHVKLYLMIDKKMKETIVMNILFILHLFIP